MIYEILNKLFGVSFCVFNKCYGGYIENGNLICPRCARTIIKNKKK